MSSSAGNHENGQPSIQSDVHDKNVSSHQIAANDSENAPTTMQTQSPDDVENCTIYDVRTPLKRKVILAGVSFGAFLLPFCDTIYLPALNIVRKDLNTTETLVALSVAIYLIMNGICSIFWGPLVDRVGRKIPMNVAMVVFVVASIVCIFAPNIAVLIVFRIIQGASISATMVVGQATISDIYPAQERATATGIFFTPFLIGPVLGPLVGGALSEAYGWRSTFVLLSIVAFVIFVFVLVLVPETHQSLVKERFEKMNPKKRIIDFEMRDSPSIKQLWKPLTFLCDLAIVPYVAMTTTTFIGLFVCLTLFPNHLEESPYNYKETIIGVFYVPAGFTMLIGSILGGRLSDKCGRHFGNKNCPEYRLIPAISFAFLTPIGLLLYGWGFHYKLHVAIPIVGQIMISFSRSSLLPGIFAYLTITKQKDAGSVVGTNTLLNFCGAGVGVAVAIPLEDALGTGTLFSIISGINLVAIVTAGIYAYARIKRANRNIIPNADPPTELIKPDEIIVASTNEHVIPNV